MGAMIGRRDRVLGIRIDTRRRRRGLVVGCYVFLLAVVAGGMLLPADSLVWCFNIAYWAALGVNYFVLGGYAKAGSPGLVKAFANRPPRHRDESVQSDLIRVNLQVHTGLEWGAVVDEEAWKNDEREIARRDAVHYQAYQVMSVVMAVMLLLATWSVHRPSFMPERVLPWLLLGVALPSVVLALTLPQAILLWTEPELGE